VDTERFNDLDSLMAAMVSGDDSYRYSVAWIDGTARGAKLGRGVLTRGDHAVADDVVGIPAKAVPTGAAPSLRSPSVPISPLNRLSIAMFNEAYFRRAPKSRAGEIQGLTPFFYPLDVMGGWNRIYGPGGFLQYQFAVPDNAGEVVRTSLEQLGAIGAPSFLSVLKRFGPGRQRSPLSFPMAGWTLAVDVPTRVDGLAQVLDSLDELVLAAGGRLYLAKDSRMIPSTLERGYRQLEEFRAVRRELDPNGVFTSDLARRLLI
jgi:decaprenylphospho-beta-D-ribofuranose 2-oxidase